MIDLILGAARAGDTIAARYVIDRVLGRVQTQAAPIAEDYSLPPDHPGTAAQAEVCRRRRLALEFLPPEAEHGRPDDVEPSPTHDVYMLGKLIYYTLTGGKQFVRERFADSEANIEAIFSRPELAALNKRLFARMIVEDPTKRLQSMDAVIAEIDAVLATLFGRGAGEADPKLVFSFIKSEGPAGSGDHPGLAMVPVWLPRCASRLIIDIAIRKAEALFGVELWDDKGKVFDSGKLKDGHYEAPLPDGTGGKWYKLRVSGDSGWGSTYVANLIVHAVSDDTFGW